MWEVYIVTVSDILTEFKKWKDNTKVTFNDYCNYLQGPRCALYLFGDKQFEK